MSSQRLVSGRSKQLRSQRRRAAPTQKPWTRQINAPSSAHIAVRRVGPGVRTRRARKGCSGWIRVTDTRSRCRRAAGTAYQQGRPRADTVTELTAGGHTEHRSAGESDRPHAWVTKQLRRGKEARPERAFACSTRTRPCKSPSWPVAGAGRGPGLPGWGRGCLRRPGTASDEAVCAVSCTSVKTHLPDT